MTPTCLVETASEVLDGIAITDHNSMAGIEPAVQAAPRDFLVIPGEEIDTSAGQVIGLFLTSEIPPGLSVEETVGNIHEQGGLAYAPHPFDSMRDGLEPVEAYTDLLDGIEVLNSRCVRDVYNLRAERFANEHDLPMFGGSDAHFRREVGNACTRVDVDRGAGEGIRPDLSSVSMALRTGRTQPTGDRSSRFNHVGTKLLKIYRSWA